jgi:lipopolysaccharide/colanic/teichoic acid biosynthesis glycosyltransferase
LWSVIAGEMSLVGPRPLPDYHLARFEPKFLDLRRQVKPGISGYWQVTDRSDSDIEQHMASDRYYIENWSLWLDLWVLFRTAEAVLSRRGAV